MRLKCNPTLLLIGALTIAVMVGCGGDQDKKAADKEGKTAEHAEHPHEGPHGGLLVEIGKEEYHVEVCHSDKTHAVTVYVLDSTAKKVVPIAEKQITINLIADGKPTQFDLPAKPMDGEPAGQSSRFELVDKTLTESHGAETAKARVKLSIGGQEYTGFIEAHEEGEHDH
jgi:hypothetical protein